MQRRWVLLTGSALLVAMPNPARAEEKIQAFLSSKGKVVFTNTVENTPPPVPPIIPESHDLLATQMPAVLKTLVDVVASNHGIDPALVRAVMKVESNFNRWAVSHKGAQGLMQLIPATARRFGVRDPFDPQQNIEGGVKYLKFLLEKFDGNLDLALAGYNAGENLVERLGRIPPITETRNYVRKIRASYRKPSTPIAAAPALQTPGIAAAPPQAIPAAESSNRIFRSVDHRGVVRFSNIEPPD